jgi:uncharacterized protein
LETSRERACLHIDTPQNQMQERTLVSTLGRTNGAVAGAVAGVGSTEVARRDLSDEQIRALVRSEIDAADQFIAGGHFARTEAMHAEVAILSDLLGDV